MRTHTVSFNYVRLLAHRGRFSPYVTGGLGFVVFDRKFSGETQARLAGNFGGGVDIRLHPRVSLRAEVRDFHTRRARQIFVGVYRPQATIVRVSAAPDLGFDPQAWWQSRDGRKYLFLEVLKWTYTWFELWTLPEEGSRENAASAARSPPTLGRFGVPQRLVNLC